MDTALLSTSDLGRSLSGRSILSSIRIEISAQDKVLLLGANGSGKTSLLRVLAGLDRPSKGKVERATELSFCAHSPQLYEYLSVEENLRLFSELRSSEWKSFEEELEYWKLAPLRKRYARELSTGEAMRVSLARTFAAASPLLLFDEPSSHLDDNITELLFRRLSAFSGAFILASHDLSRFKGLANRYVVLQGGELTFDSAEEDAEQSALSLYREQNR